MRSFTPPFLAALGMILLSIAAGLSQGHMVNVGHLEISHAWARVMLPNQPAGAGYLVIANSGTEADTLISASSPAAGKVEVHTMQVVDNVMTMRPVEGGLEIPAGETVELMPGGLHLMFMAVSDSFDEGETVPVTLEFEHAGPVDIELPVGSGEGSMKDSSDH